MYQLLRILNYKFTDSKVTLNRKFIKPKNVDLVLFNWGNNTNKFA